MSNAADGYLGDWAPHRATCKCADCVTQRRITALEAQVERMTAALGRIVSDFEMDYVLDGAVVDDPPNTYRAAWEMAKAALAGQPKEGAR